MHDWRDDWRDATLDSLLRTLAAQDDALSLAPGRAARIEARVMDAWDARPQASRRLRVAKAGAALLAGAVAAAVIFALALPRPTAGPSPIRPHAAADVALLPAPVPDIPTSAAAVAEPRTAGAPASSHSRRRVSASRPAGAHAATARAPQPRASREAVDDDVETLRFLTLAPDAERELASAFQLSRVRIPRRVLIDLGVLDEAHRSENPDAPVDADVAFGEDGQARAIRLTPIGHRGAR